MGFSEVVRRPGDFAVAGAYAELGAHTAVTWFGVGPRPQRIVVSQWPADDQDRRALLTELAGTLELEPHDEYKRTIAVHVALRAIQDAEGARE
jgi:carbon-monoxide dehydrogenase medium subunit